MTAQATRPSGRWMSTRSRALLDAAIFLGPFIVLYVLFMIYPLAKGFWISLHDWELVGTFREYIGFLNYADLLEDDLFWLSLRNTGFFVLLAVPTMTGLALTLALALNRDTRWHNFLRGVFFATTVFSVTVVTLVWTMVLNGDRGLMANIFRSFGLEPIDFLRNGYFAMPSLVVATVWWGVGLPTALFVAALQQVPKELYEAAELDHASRWRVLWHVTLPSIQRTVVLVLVLQVVAQFQIFGQALIMTEGGPNRQTFMLVQYIYDTGFRDWALGYASAMSMILFVIMFAVSMLQIFIGRREERS